MAHALALVAAPIRTHSVDALRMGIVTGCALALILAERALPLL